MRARYISAGLLAMLLPCVAFSEEVSSIPACALSGATSVMIGGRPALRLSDVINCPPELYEIVQSIFVEGQPVVHFRSGSGAKADCAAKGDPSVTLEGEAAQRLGDVACQSTSD